MKFYILTLFPEMIEDALNTSILGRAKKAGSISFEAINIRDYTLDKHKKVDDYPYGGGAGMVMQAQPIYDAYQAVCQNAGHKVHCIYLTPQGKLFNQTDAKELALKEDICLLCGHYEGIDERVLEEIVDEYYSIGDYVLTGGELPSLVMIDAISRMVPGVLTNAESGEDESLENNLLEYPQYSRPEVWNDRRVPPILLSGDHAKVDAWRKEQSIERTKERRPDLYQKYLENSVD
ncbi:tRNA (guanosine(37)-N1)-methyltransferase TrmD [Pseudobutyrivibrio sp.]|jgi:tRNA (guanine37-N1)-methyltransferase|uniref:tRNA (guanosine(37)-N1)-methyltransferase TrmD n=1 Tax=Pseudobutyrivibrio sp. TaxID=2014367 RepID=UPI0025F26DF4|nr:tRNA (guanosine(37)-N1)-methyltransferase TrmD [Pseudobutyrivibrio sp.]